MTPLYLAIEKDHLDCGELLLKHKADPNREVLVTRGEGREVAPMAVGADSCMVGV